MTSQRFINRRDLKVLDKVLQNVLHTDKIEMQQIDVPKTSEISA